MKYGAVLTGHSPPYGSHCDFTCLYNGLWLWRQSAPTHFTPFWKWERGHIGVTICRQSDAHEDSSSLWHTAVGLHFVFVSHWCAVDIPAHLNFNTTTLLYFHQVCYCTHIFLWNLWWSFFVAWQDWAFFTAEFLNYVTLRLLNCANTIREMPRLKIWHETPVCAGVWVVAFSDTLYVVFMRRV